MTSHRLRWSELPGAVRDNVESVLGATVVRTQSGVGGYSPSFASRCDLDDGRRVFVKAVSSEQNPDSPVMLRREMDVTRRLPASVPAPRLLHSMDDGNWVVGVFEYVDGRTPRVPWDPADLDMVVDAVAQLASTPVIDELDSAALVLSSAFGRGALLADDPPDDLDPWLEGHLDDLVRVESGWRDAVSGDSLVHLDVRSDNVLIEPTGRVVFVDWPHGCIGAPWLDLVLMIPSLVLEGAGEPEDLLELGAVSADRNAIDAVVAGLAGTFTWGGRLPDPPGLPTLRAFQRSQAVVSLRWLRTRLGDPEPQ